VAYEVTELPRLPEAAGAAGRPQGESLAERFAAIADAYRYVQTGEKAGVVVIDVVTEGRAAEPG